MPTLIEARKTRDDARTAYYAALKTYSDARNAGRTAEESELRTQLDNSKAAYMRAARAAKAVRAKAGPKIVVTREEPVYRQDTGPRFFHDLYASTMGNNEAAERLERNNKIRREKRQTGTIEGQGFEAPQWMADLWVDYPFQVGALEAAVPHSPMPPKGFAAHIPKVSTPLIVGSQAESIGPSVGVNEDVQNSDVTSTTVDANLVTIAGRTEVDLPVFLRSAPNGDVFLGADLQAAVAQETDRQLAWGNPGSPVISDAAEHLGLLNISGATDITWTESSPTPQKFLAMLAESMYTFYVRRQAYPTHIVLSPARAAWALSGISDANAPLFANGGFYPGMAADGTFPAGSLLGMKVLATSSINEDFSQTGVYGDTGSQHDFVALWRPSDAAYASTERTFEARETADVNSNLAVQLTCYQYAYAWLHRQPSSVGIITGTGLINPY